MSDINKNDWRDFLAHYGVKGMKWGKRNKQKYEPTWAGKKAAHDQADRESIMYTRAQKKNWANPNATSKRIAGSTQRSSRKMQGIWIKDTEGSMRYLPRRERSQYTGRTRDRMRELSKVLKKKKRGDIPKKAFSKAKKFLSRLFG